MAKWRVYGRTTGVMSALVEADTPEEARRKAKACEFSGEAEQVEWEIEDVDLDDIEREEG